MEEAGIMRRYSHLLMILGMSVFFFTGLGHVHLFDWDEINFAESAREMIETSNYLSVQINYQPFWEKPPLFFWMQAISMKVFGINEFAARFPNAVFGIIYLMTLSVIGKKFSSEKNFPRIWMLLMFGSFLPHIYFKSGIIDPVFNYFIFLSVYFVYRVFESEGKSLKVIFLSGLFCGLSFLTKGPVGLLLLMGTIGLVSLTLIFFNDADKGKFNFTRGVNTIKRLFFRSFVWYPIFIFLFGFLSVVSVWIGAELYFHGWDILNKFVQYQIELFTEPVASHGQPFYYHFVVVFFGCFPASVFAIPQILKFSPKTGSSFTIWMVSLFWVVIIIFSLSTTKIVHYSSMTYLPLTFLAAIYFQKLIAHREKIKNYILILYILLGVLWFFIFLLVPYILKNPSIILPYISDQAAINSLLMSSIMNGYEPIIGIIFATGILTSIWYIIQKKLFKALWIVSISVGMTLMLTNFMILPAVERLSQGPAINFYKTLADQDVYVTPIGFKSYAQYFYAKTKPQLHSRNADIEWLVKGDIDKDVYFVSKSDNTELEKYQDIQKIRSEGGFSFYVRNKKKD
ncbi:MAG: glycosyltransferase family 39 protein [Saprospiraceae bacterium]|nr:glycosyltransferase family 39 protein [Saprospiraceae bacterium]